MPLRRKEDSPSLQQGDDAAHEEQPDTPARRPETTTRALPYRTSVEAVVDEMLEVLGHAYLPHQLILVPVHTGQGTNMREDVLERIGELEGVDVAQTELHVCVDHELRQTKDLTT